ncbi:uncharacterized protein LOC118481750 [Helianthus annuus]|uniref:uncharacterized protein LOC118481750 n=1 Tax=Helianthus annuus TaxID=4232 RepID=UPI001652EBAF|nr:uncharacterized protein LOC118481750 [Helianthus annuus]
MYERLGLGELSPTRMSLSLADRSVKYPRGIIENLLVKVDKFVFPVDFVVLDMEADEKVPIILGRPFLCTAKAIIDVFDGKITLQVESFLSCVDHCFDYISGADLVESRIDETVEKVEEVVSESGEVDEDEWVPEVLELSEIKSESESTPIEKPAPLELKVLPSHLEYAFLEIKDKKGAENLAADHLSRLEDPKREEVREDSIGDTFPHETIDFVSAEVEGLPWFSDLANYLATGDLVRGMSYQQKKKLLREARKYIWDDPYLFRIGGDRVLRKCVSKEEELEHRALWALKTVNLDLTEAARRRFFHIHELEALRDAAYERSWSIKEKSKALHDRRLRGLKDFKVGDKVLLFNSRLKLIAGKLKSRWNGPYVVKEVFPYGTVELYDEVDKGVWKVNGHRLKHYLGGPIDSTEEEEIPLEDPPTFAEQ